MKRIKKQNINKENGKFKTMNNNSTVHDSDLSEGDVDNCFLEPNADSENSYSAEFSEDSNNDNISDSNPNGWFEDEAMEDNETIESEVDENRESDDESEHELAFQAGGTGGHAKEILKNGQLNRIDDFSSNSEDDGDLSDFIVDDEVVQYTSNDSDELPDCENLSSSNDESTVILSRKRKSVIVSSDEEDRSSLTKEKINGNYFKRANINSESSDDDNEFYLNLRGYKNSINASNGQLKPQNCILSSNDLDETSEQATKKLKSEPLNSESPSKEKKMIKCINNNISSEDSYEDSSVTANFETTTIDFSVYAKIFENLHFGGSYSTIIPDLELEDCDLHSDSLESFQNNYSKLQNIFYSYNYKQSVRYLIQLLNDALECHDQTEVYATLLALLTRNVSPKIGIDTLVSLLALAMKRKEKNRIQNLLSLMLVWNNLKIMKTSYVVSVFKMYFKDYIHVPDHLMSETIIFLNEQLLDTSHNYLISQDFYRGESIEKLPGDLDTLEKCQKFISNLLVKDQAVYKKIEEYYHSLAGKSRLQTLDLCKNTQGDYFINENLVPDSFNSVLIYLNKIIFNDKFTKCSNKLTSARLRRVLRENTSAAPKDFSFIINYGQVSIVLEYLVKQIILGDFSAEQYAPLIVKYCKHSNTCKKYLKEIIWNDFLEINSLKSTSLENLSHLLYLLIIKRCFNLTAIKKLDFAKEGKSRHIVHQVLFKLLHSPPKNKVLFNIFKLVSNSPKHKVFRSRLRNLINTKFTKKYIPKHQIKRIKPTMNLVIKYLNNDNV